MTAKAETTFYRSVHAHLPPGLYHEKQANPYRGGQPDVYYEARTMFWVEYKFVILPARPTTLVSVDLSALQLEWLCRNHANGHAPLVIVGSKEGGVVLTTPAEWKTTMTRQEFEHRTISRKEIAHQLSLKSGV